MQKDLLENVNTNLPDAQAEAISWLFRKFVGQYDLQQLAAMASSPLQPPSVAPQQGGAGGGASPSTGVTEKEDGVKGDEEMAAQQAKRDAEALAAEGEEDKEGGKNTRRKNQ